MIRLSVDRMAEWVKGSKKPKARNKPKGRNRIKKITQKRTHENRIHLGHVVHALLAQLF